MSKKILLSLSLCIVLNASILARANAVEIVIEGNGTSSNQIQIATQTNTTVNQTNESNITNNVENNTNTGENDANGNSGNSTIQTGNSENNTTVLNENINTNFAKNETCDCNHTLDIKVSENGAGSTNSVNSTISKSSTVNQTNNAVINNTITVNANTGKNQASYNLGNAIIKTGSITSSVNVENKNINNSYALITLPSISANILISENGKNSENTVYLNIQKNLISNNSNNANILNSIFTFLNTGENKANGNSGNVAILTGDIVSNILISNENINSNFVHADCECEKKEPKPTPTITPPPSPTVKPGNGDHHPSDGSVGGASAAGNSAGEVLPATGSYFLYLVTLASLITFFAGWYLRFRSGIAPGK